MVELLQRAHIEIEPASSNNSKDSNRVVTAWPAEVLPDQSKINLDLSTDAGEKSLMSNSKGGESPSIIDQHAPKHTRPSRFSSGATVMRQSRGDGASLPDLHRMGTFFLSPIGAKIFDAFVVLHFVAVLISYNLAGAAAYGDLLGLDSNALIIPYWAGYCCVIIFGPFLDCIHPTISILTVAKCGMLFAVLGAVGAVGGVTKVKQRDGWGNILEPFLIGTFALGGVVNTMPVTYSRLPFEGGPGLSLEERRAAVAANRVMLSRYRMAVCTGVVLCWVLNLLWCNFVLEIVPQSLSSGSEVGERIQKLIALGLENATLEHAALNGQISTLPLTDIIKHDPRLSEWAWVAPLVDGFIVVSVSVSFITLGTGLKHVLDGIVFSRIDRRENSNDGAGAGAGAGAGFGKKRSTCTRCGDRLDPPLACTPLRSCVKTVFAFSILLYGLGFGLILLIAVSNPKGFLDIIEIFGSLALNIECGIFVCLMCFNSNSFAQYTGKYVPLPLSAATRKFLVWSSGLVFSLAVGYDVITAGVPLMGWSVWLSLVGVIAGLSCLAFAIWLWYVRSRRA